MALENLAVEGMTVELVDKTPTDLTATLAITSLPTNDIIAGGGKVYLDQCLVVGTNFASVSVGGAAAGPVNGNLEATTNVNFNQSTKLLRENDQTTGLTVQLATSGAPVTATFKYKITDANQNVVMGL
jgi:hypothetical protein